MKVHRKKVVFTVPWLQDQGGVASYYNGIMPFLPRQDFFALEIGGSKSVGGFFHPAVDQLRFRRTLKKWNPELVHLNPSLGFKSFFRDGVFAWQTKQLGYPLIVFWHGWNKDFENIVRNKYLSFFKSTFGLADGFIILASEFEEVLRDWGITAPIFRQTTCVDESLCYGIDLGQKWSDPQNISTYKILFLARLTRSKGVFETVEAIKLLLDEKLNIQLTIAGDGDVRAEVEKFTRSMGLNEKQVVFTGDIRGKDKVDAFARHHIYCFPTYYGEGLPTSVLEAMTFAMPVITRPVGGLKDVFIDGEMGLLVDKKSPKHIAENLKTLISNPPRMAEIGKNNMRYADKHFMASVVAEKHTTICSEILADNKRRAFH